MLTMNAPQNDWTIFLVAIYFDDVTFCGKFMIDYPRIYYFSNFDSCTHLLIS